MNRTSPTFKSKLRSQIRRIIDSSTAGQITGVVPIAIPIIEATHSIRQNVPLNVGLTHRFVLEAISEFGPCSSADIGELLGIEETFAKRILEDLTETNADIVIGPGQYSPGEGLSEQLKRLQLSRVVDQKRKFLLNGVTGKLLPYYYAELRQSWEVIPARKRNKGFTQNAEPVKFIHFISPKAVDGRDEIQSLLESSDVEKRKELGVPEGGVFLKENTEPAICNQRWITAFAVEKLGRCHIEDAEGFELLNLCPTPYLRTITNQRIFDKEYTLRDWETKLNVIGDLEFECRLTKDNSRLGIHIGLGKQTNFEFLKNIEGDHERAFLIGKLEYGLVRHWLHDTHSGLIVDVFPLDSNSAKHACLQSGVQSLRKLYRSHQVQSNKLELTSWWEQQQDSCPALEGYELRISIAELMEVAEEFPDTEFQDWLEEQQ